MPWSWIRVSVSVRTSPPNVLGSPGPASSISTIKMFGASSGRRRGGTRWAYTDSCMVRPATLAEGVGGNGSTSCGFTGHPLNQNLARCGRSGPSRASSRQPSSSRPPGTSAAGSAASSCPSAPQAWPALLSGSSGQQGSSTSAESHSAATARSSPWRDGAVDGLVDLVELAQDAAVDGRGRRRVRGSGGVTHLRYPARSGPSAGGGSS